jgi:hypothetical protein
MLHALLQIPPIVKGSRSKHFRLKEIFILWLTIEMTFKKPSVIGPTNLAVRAALAMSMSM